MKRSMFKKVKDGKFYTSYQDDLNSDVKHFLSLKGKHFTVSLFGICSNQEKNICESIFVKTIDTIQFSKQEKDYLELLKEGYFKVELQPKQKYCKMVLSRLIANKKLSTLVRHIRTTDFPSQDEAKITLFVLEDNAPIVIEQCKKLMPIGQKIIGTGKCPLLSKKLDPLLFFACADNYLRRAFCAKPSNIISEIPQITKITKKDGIIQRRHTVAIIDNRYQMMKKRHLSLPSNII